MAFDFKSAQDAGWSEEKIRSYLNTKGRGKEADEFFSTQPIKQDGGFIDGIMDDVKKRWESANNVVARYINNGYETDPELKKQLESKGKTDVIQTLEQDRLNTGAFGKPEVGESVPGLKKTPQTEAETVLGVTGELAGGAMDVVFKPLLDKILNTTIPLLQKAPNNTPIPPALGMGIVYNVGQLKGLVNTPIVQYGLVKATQGVKAYEEFKKQDPVAAQNVESVLNIAQFFPVEKLLGIGGKFVAKTAQEAVETTSKNIITPLKKAGSDIIEQLPEAVDTLKSKAADIQSKAVNMKTTYESNVIASDTKKRALEEAEKITPGFKEVVDQGIPMPQATLLSSIKEAGGSTKQALVKLVSEVKKGASGIAADTKKILGAEMRKPIKFLSEKQKEFGRKLGEFASEITPDKLSGTQDAVFSRLKEIPELADLGIKTIRDNLGREVKDKAGNILRELDFSNTALLDDLAAQKTISDYWEKILERTGKQLHRTRQGIFEMQGGKSAAGVAFSESEDKALEAFRKGISDVLDKAHSGYKKLNLDYAQLEDVLKDAMRKFKSVAKAGEDIMNVKGGNLARRLTSNADADMKGFMKKIIDQAKKLGLDDVADIEKLQEVLNILEQYFPQKLGTTLKDEAGKAVKSTIEGFGTPVQTLIKKGLEKSPLKNIIQSDESKQAALEKFIKSLLGR